jgi:hypothetical protein
MCVASSSKSQGASFVDDRWLLPDFVSPSPTPIFMALNIDSQPRNTRWINDKESRLAQARLAEDAGEADQDTAADSYDCAW